MLERVKRHFMTMFLVVIVIVMISSIFFISFKLKETNKSRSSIPPIRTKAAQKTYSKTIALKKTIEPTEIIPTEFSTPTPTEELGSSGITESPTPTEIIIAYSNPTITGQDVFDEMASTSASPTGVENLPDAGYIGYPLLIIAIGGLILFFSFIY